MSSVQSIVAAKLPAGVFVRHACPGAFIELISYRDGEHRSLTVSEKRAIGLMQQLMERCIESRPFRIFDEQRRVLGDVGGDALLTILADLARAVLSNRRFAAEAHHHED